MLSKVRLDAPGHIFGGSNVGVTFGTRERPAIFVFLIREDEMMVATTTIVTGSKHSIGVARDGFGLRC